MNPPTTPAPAPEGETQDAKWIAGLPADIRATVLEQRAEDAANSVCRAIARAIFNEQIPGESGGGFRVKDARAYLDAHTARAVENATRELREHYAAINAADFKLQADANEALKLKLEEAEADLAAERAELASLRMTTSPTPPPPAKATDLAKWLRAYASFTTPHNPMYTRGQLYDAAAELERLAGVEHYAKIAAQCWADDTARAEKAEAQVRIINKALAARNEQLAATERLVERLQEDGSELAEHYRKLRDTYPDIIYRDLYKRWNEALALTATDFTKQKP